jgi:hypothetical protein
MWLLPIAVGIAIVRVVRGAPVSQPDAGPSVWMRILRLEWVNAVAAFFIERMAGLLRGLSIIVEGEGGLIWSMILVIVGLVLATGAVK